MRPTRNRGRKHVQAEIGGGACARWVCGFTGRDAWLRADGVLRGKRGPRIQRADASCPYEANQGELNGSVGEDQIRSGSRLVSLGGVPSAWEAEFGILSTGEVGHYRSGPVVAASAVDRPQRLTPGDAMRRTSPAPACSTAARS